MTDWQPIETAPKDGERILVYSTEEGILTSHFADGVWHSLPWRPELAMRQVMPTHWQPLPPPPN